MLAQNFKTPTDLQLTDAEFEALVKVLGMFDRGELKHIQPDMPAVDGNYSRGFSGHFNMIRIAIPYGECGTSACILGTARLMFGEHLFESFDKPKRHPLPPALNNLFFPIREAEFKSVTVEQAAIALRNYLTHGEPRWDEALAE